MLQQISIFDQITPERAIFRCTAPSNEKAIMIANSLCLVTGRTHIAELQFGSKIVRLFFDPPIPSQIALTSDLSAPPALTSTEAVKSLPAATGRHGKASLASSQPDPAFAGMRDDRMAEAASSFVREAEWHRRLRREVA